jgi:hypothetical protein
MRVAKEWGGGPVEHDVGQRRSGPSGGWRPVRQGRRAGRPKGGAWQ